MKKELTKLASDICHNYNFLNSRFGFTKPDVDIDDKAGIIEFKYMHDEITLILIYEERDDVLDLKFTKNDDASATPKSFVLYLVKSKSPYSKGFNEKTDQPQDVITDYVDGLMELPEDYFSAWGKYL